MLCC